MVIYWVKRIYVYWKGHILFNMAICSHNIEPTPYLLCGGDKTGANFVFKIGSVI